MVISYIPNPLSLSDANVQSLLNQPDEFLGSFRDSGETEKKCSELIVAYRKGFPVTVIVGAGLAATATLIVVCLMPQVHLDWEDDEKAYEESKRFNSTLRKESTPSV